MPKRDPDERVSLAPLDPEAALRGLLASPPVDDDTDESDQPTDESSGSA